MSNLHIDNDQLMELTSNKKRRKKSKRTFWLHWVKLPVRWVKALRQSKQASTYQLAHVILVEAFKQEQTGGEIVLSTVTTGMPRSTKVRAVNELVKLGLITVKRNSRRAVRVVELK
jgi:hypothetical protein